jgi:DNA-binding CsgD family transcriptional regulator
MLWKVSSSPTMSVGVLVTLSHYDPRARLRASPLLVGREREYTVLRRSLDAAFAGHGGVVLLSGEAGIGKTALAGALGHEAAEHGAVVFAGRCYDYTEAAPYGLWIDLFTRHHNAGNVSPLPSAFAQPGTVGTVTSQVALFNQVVDFLRMVAASRPIVLLIDDLHWADPASLDLLRLIARASATLPMLIIAAYRADELTPDDPLYHIVPMLARETNAERLSLAPLIEEDLRMYVDARYGLAPEEMTRLARYSLARTEGNPFFVTELLHSLEEERVLDQRGEWWALGDLPSTGVPLLLRQVVDARLTRLGAAARPLLAIAAVIGQEAPLDLWRVASGGDDSALLDVVERAIAARILDETADGTAVRFVHALIRDALYEGMLASRRRLWHREIAAAIAAAPDPDPDAMAHHLTAAGDTEAVEWLIQAGLRAQRACAWQTAMDRYEAALALIPDTDATAGERGWLMFARARLDIYYPLGTSPHLATAARLAERAGDRVLAAVVAYFSSLSRYNLGDVRGGIASMEAVVATLQALSAEERALLRARRSWIGRALDADDGAGQLAFFLALAGRFAEARALAERLLATPLSVGERRERGQAHAQALLARAIVAAFSGVPDAAREAARQSWQACEDLAAYDEAGQAMYVKALWVEVAYWPEHADIRARLVDDLLRTWPKAGVSLMPHGSADLMRLPLAGIAGEWEIVRSLADHLPLGSVTVEIIPRPILASIAFGQGDTARVWEIVREVLPDGPATEPGGTNILTALTLQCLAAEMSLGAGDPTAARAWLEAHDRWLAWSGATLGQAAGDLCWAHYHRACGDIPAASARAAQALQGATEPRQPLILLAAHRLLGELAIDAQRFDDASAHLDTSLALGEACGAPYERALTLLAQAELRVATRAKAEALVLLDTARAICTALGAMPSLARADALAARGAARTAAHPTGLTQREIEVLRLLASGSSNREIGGALSMSVRTAERHINNIYTKINARGRAEATAFALRHKLAEGIPTS